jgi:hypothetical protein
LAPLIANLHTNSSAKTSTLLAAFIRINQSNSSLISPMAAANHLPLPPAGGHT